MTSPKPDDRQQVLGYDRGRQWQALRHLRCGSSDAKHLLRALDDHIGNGRHTREQQTGRVPPDYSWSISVDQLAAECELGRSTAFRALRQLEEIGYVRWSGKRGMTPRFTICWAVIFGEEEVPLRDFSGDKQLSRSGTELSQMGTPKSRSGTPKSQSGTSYMKSAPLSAPVSAPPPPEETSAAGGGGEIDEPEAGKAEALELLRQAGVATAPETYAAAIDVGQTDAQVIAVCRYYLANHAPENWRPGALVHRLKLADAARLLPHEGWPDRKARPQGSATADSTARSAELSDRETRHGSDLDELPDAELRSLVSLIGQRSARTAQGMLTVLNSGRDPRRDDQYRPLLLQVMAISRERQPALAGSP